MIRKRVRLFTCVVYTTVPKALTPLALIGWVRTIGWYRLCTLFLALFFIWRHAVLPVCWLSLSGRPRSFGQLFFPQVGVGHLLFKLLNLPTLPSFLLLIAKAITQFFVHLGLNLWFWPCTSMVPPVFSDLIARYFFSLSLLGLFLFTLRFMALSLCLLCTVVIDFVTVVFTMTYAS